MADVSPSTIVCLPPPRRPIRQSRSLEPNQPLPANLVRFPDRDGEIVYWMPVSRRLQRALEALGLAQ